MKESIDTMMKNALKGAMIILRELNANGVVVRGGLDGSAK